MHDTVKGESSAKFNGPTAEHDASQEVPQFAMPQFEVPADAMSFVCKDALPLCRQFRSSKSSFNLAFPEVGLASWSTSRDELVRVAWRVCRPPPDTGSRTARGRAPTSQRHHH